MVVALGGAVGPGQGQGGLDGGAIGPDAVGHAGERRQLARARIAEPLLQAEEITLCPVRAAPYTPPLVVPAPAASAVASRGADAEWPAILRELDAIWEQDWPRTIAVLDHFLDRWPGYGAAEDKLYAALVADAEDNIQAEQVADGVAELERAARRQPGRGEAWARLAQLATAAPGEQP